MNSPRTLLLAFTVSCLGIAARAAPASAPNIILIYADDVGYGDLGCYGGTGVDTPNLDRLAQSGRRFTSAYATSSTCTPSRYSLLTGRYAFRNEAARILPGNAPLIIDPIKPTLPALLQTRGYITGLVGKWHLGLGDQDHPLDWNTAIAPGPREVGFEYSYHMAATGDRVPAVYIENGRVLNLEPDDPITVSYEGPVGSNPTGTSHPHLLKVQADKQHSGTIVDGTSRIGFMSGGAAARWTDEEMPDVFLERAVGFIESNQNRPFFLYYATHENHVPRLPHPRFRGASGLGVRGDAIAQLDWGVGVLLETLRKLDLTKNTLVIFSSDNGPVLFDGYHDGAYQMNGDHRPAGPWRGGKYSAWEGGTRMPFIASWPGTISPGPTEAMISQVDLLASLAALTGAACDATDGPVDSENHIDAILGRSEEGRSLLVQQSGGMKTLRQGPWKYIPPGRVGVRDKIGRSQVETIAEPGGLFFLPEDPAEQNNLAATYPAKVRQMRILLEQELDRGSH